MRVPKKVVLHLLSIPGNIPRGAAPPFVMMYRKASRIREPFRGLRGTLVDR